jgi:hypothetical protein
MRAALPGLLATSALAVALAGCSGGGGSTPQGALSLSITDAPVHNVDEVWVQFSGITVNPRQGNSVEIVFPAPIQVDLMALAGENSTMILNGAALDAGEYNWIRLDVDADADAVLDSYVMTDTGEMIELELTNPRGLQLSSGFTITQGTTTSFIVDWDLNQALTAPEDRESWLLRPSLRITDESQYGTIIGVVADALLTDPSCTNDLAEDAGTTVYLFEGAGRTPDDIDGDEGDPLTTAPVTQGPGGDYGYLVAYVPPGEYTLALSCQALDDVPDSDQDILFARSVNVTVVDDRDSFVDFLP